MNEEVERLKRIFEPEHQELEDDGVNVEIVEEKDREPERIKLTQGSESVSLSFKALDFISGHPENAEKMTANSDTDE